MMELPGATKYARWRGWRVPRASSRSHLSAHCSRECGRFRVQHLEDTVFLRLHAEIEFPLRRVEACLNSARLAILRLDWLFVDRFKFVGAVNNNSLPILCIPAKQLEDIVLDDREAGNDEYIIIGEDSVPNQRIIYHVVIEVVPQASDNACGLVGIPQGKALMSQLVACSWFQLMYGSGGEDGDARVPMAFDVHPLPELPEHFDHPWLVGEVILVKLPRVARDERKHTGHDELGRRSVGRLKPTISLVVICRDCGGALIDMQKGEVIPGIGIPDADTILCA